MVESFGRGRLATLYVLMLLCVPCALCPSPGHAQQAGEALRDDVAEPEQTLPASGESLGALTEALERLLAAPEAEKVKGALSHAAHALEAATKVDGGNDTERARRARAVASAALFLAERQIAVVRERALLRSVTLRLERARAALRAHRASRRALSARRAELIHTLAHPPAPEVAPQAEPEGAEN